MTKAHGSIINRLEEVENFAPIEVGTDVTKCHWSGRACYYITKVIDQKHIFVKRYYICADQDAASTSNKLKYFKSQKEKNDYLRKYFPDAEYDDTDNNNEEEWIFRYNSWRKAIRRNYSDVLAMVKKHKEFLNGREENIFKSEEHYIKFVIQSFLTSTKTNAKKLAEGKEVIEYFDLYGKISFGVRDIYYDYRF